MGNHKSKNCLINAVYLYGNFLSLIMGLTADTSLLTTSFLLLANVKWIENDVTTFSVIISLQGMF